MPFYSLVIKIKYQNNTLVQRIIQLENCASNIYFTEIDKAAVF